MHICAICKRTDDETQVHFCSSFGDYLCSKHKNQWYRKGAFSDGHETVRICEICGDRNIDGKKIHWCEAAQKYLCLKHRSQFNRLGSFLIRTKRDRNEYIIHEEYAEIVFRDKDGNISFTSKIDIEDVPRCRPYKWYVTEMMGNTRYVKSIINGKNTGLHRFLLNACDKNPVDHIDRNGLNNMKANLRLVTPSENCVNSRPSSATGEKNIYYKNGKYQVQIIRNYKCVYTETFDTLNKAVCARNDFLEKYNREHHRCV